MIVSAYKRCVNTVLGMRYQLYSMGLLTDRLTKRNNDKQKDEFKKEITFLANKPTFTILDYKQRINDELYKLKNSFKNRLNSETQEAQKLLEEEKKIMDALFEEELNEEKKLKGSDKEEIATVTQEKIENVNEVLKKVEKYKKMHAVLRAIKEKGDPLPEDSTEFNYAYLQSGVEQSNRNNRYLKYKPMSTKKRVRHIKFERRK